MRILVVGGYGTFGGRLARLLADEERVELLIAGRSVVKAEAFLHELQSIAGAEGAQLRACRFDREGDLDEQLARLAPDLVVDASGPFQGYGDNPYRLVSAVIKHHINYIDLADASGFVNGIATYDQAARAADIYVLSGVSSFPVLTAAVVRRLSAGMARLTSVEGGIAPSPYAGVGLNVIKAITSYAGKPVKLKRDGRTQTARGLVETQRRTIRPPGSLPLRNTLFSLVDVPDLRTLPSLWPSLQSVWIGAGPAPEILHRALIGLSRLVHLGVIPTLSPFAGFFHRAINLLRWGEHRGGMYVDVTGIDSDGGKIRRSWHMLAEGDHGPLIPSMAAEAIIRRCLDDRAPAAGARSGAADLELADYERLFEKRDIKSGCWDVATDDARTGAKPLYRLILGAAWERLPAAIRAVHDFTDEYRLQGIADVERGDGIIARSIAALFGFPATGAQIPAGVTFRVDNGREIWTRDFAGRRFSSIQSAGRGYAEGLLVEAFGPFRFNLALITDGAKLRLVTRGWSLFGVPLPSVWAPTGDSFETEIDGRFRFHVEIRHPFCGLIVKYAGWLERSAGS